LGGIEDAYLAATAGELSRAFGLTSPDWAASPERGL
jgi:hypothetical protein